MRYRNAADGIRKIYRAEILSLLAGIGAVIMAALAVAGKVADEAGEAGASGGLVGGALVLLIVVGIMTLISFVLNIIGVSRAASDENDFRQALTWLIIGLICSLFSGFFTNSHPQIASLMETAADVFKMVSTIFVITGIISIANKTGHPEVAAKGNGIVRLIIIMYIVVIAVQVLGVILKAVSGNTASTITGVAGVLIVIAAILSVVIYFIYLRLLSQAKKMF